jgi:hypothetical protein
MNIPMIIPAEPGMVSLKVAVHKFGVTYDVIRRLIIQRVLASARDGATILIRPNDLQSYLSSRAIAR